MVWSSLDELRHWLAAVPIDTTTWGQNGTKTVAALWQELLVGDTQLQTNPPQRQVQVVEIVIRRGGQVLIEAAQELADGQIRRRGIFPAEKIKAREEIETAVLRGLQEELGVAPENVVILKHTYQHSQALRNSPSYPGLPTLYTIHRLAVQIKGLPDGDFWHDNLAYDQDDPVKRHLWSWQPWADHKV